MLTHHTRSTPTVHDHHLGLPPPLALELNDMDRVVGWVHGDRITFRGFASAPESAHAAWVAYRTIARRLARRDGARPIPISTEPLSLVRRGTRDLVVASGRPIATIVRAAPTDHDDGHRFGFELHVPGTPDEVTMRSLAYLAYRTLRRSGMRWAMWARPERDSAPASAPAASASAAPAHAAAGPSAEREPDRPDGGIDWGLAFLGVVAIAVILLVTPGEIVAPLAMAGAGMVIGALALAALHEGSRRWWERRDRAGDRAGARARDGSPARPRVAPEPGRGATA